LKPARTRVTRPLKAARARLAAALAVCSFGAACGEAAPPATVAAPVTPRATAVLEPPRIRIGERTALEVAVITPPGHRSPPFEPVDAVPELEMLGTEALPVVKEASRWIHRTRVHLRARDVGRFAWPGGSVAVTAPDGATSRLAVAPIAIEVVSVLPEFPDRMAPFGARAAPPARGGAQVALPAAAAGALLTLAAVGLVALVQRRTAALPGAEVEPAAGAAPSWTVARGDLELARNALPADPGAAADAAAVALRRFMARRFGAVAEARTTEELELQAPPFAATSRWPVFVSLLRDLDALRFPARRPGARAHFTAEVESALSRAEAFVEESTPPERLR
jgi:hypothetical protein